jgi:hypothetical protein
MKLTTEEITYPSSDGQPMADSTIQYQWITKIQGGCDALFRDDPNVFVAGDLLWYPVEGKNTICQAPDVMVVFGRPKGDRRSYSNGRRIIFPHKSSLKSAPIATVRQRWLKNKPSIIATE